MVREIEILRNRQANVTFAEGPEPIQSASTIRNESMGVPPQYEDNHGLPGHNGGALIRSGNLATNTLLSGFSAPIAPTYKGTMTDARRAFAREYMEYVRAVSAVSESTGMLVQIRPIDTCIEYNAKEFAAEMLIKKPMGLITEDEWLAFFQVGLDIRSDQVTELESRIKRAIVMSDKELDADKRVDTWIYSYWQLIRKMNMPDYHVHYPKEAVKCLVDGIRPTVLRDYIQQELSHGKKYLRNSLYQFIDFVREELRQHMKLVRTSTALKSSDGAQHRSNDKSADRVNDKKDGRSDNSTSSKRDLKKLRASQSDPPATQDKPAKLPICWSCKGSHRIQTCPTTTETMKMEIIERKRAEIAATASNKPQAKALKLPIPRRGRCLALIPETGSLGPITTLIDSGSDSSAIVSFGLIDYLEQCTSIPLSMTWLSTPVIHDAFGADVAMQRHITLPSLVLQTTGGELTLLHVNFWVDERDKDLNITLGRPLMTMWGYDTSMLLAKAYKQQSVWDFSLLSVFDTDDTGCKRALRKIAPCDVEESDVLEDSNGIFDDIPDHSVDIPTILDRKVNEAILNGLSPEGAANLNALLQVYYEVFRVDFQHDPPISVPPLQITVKPGATPIKCRPRRYSPNQMAYLRSHLSELENHGLVYRNNQSRWASPPRNVPKKNGDLRMTVDMRALNAVTEPLQWPMPVLEVVMSRLQGKKVFFVCDWFKGFWQLPLHPDSQEMFTIMGVDSMNTSTRVLMGHCNAVAYCQFCAQTVYGERYGDGLEAWLDDVLGNAKSESELLAFLEFLFRQCRQFGLKLNPLKCDFFTTEVVWCGKRLSAAGVSHDPSRINGLLELEPPQDGQQLQQFVCALNWMRNSIPQFNQLIALLQKLLDDVCTAADSRKKSRLIRFRLLEHGWNSTHLLAFNQCKSALQAVVTLAHPDPDKAVCLFTDASNDFWGAVVTQIPTDDEGVDLVNQRHEPLAFLSGSFKGAQLRWSTIEKEGFAIVTSCKRLDYILQRPGGFKIFTDHRNLKFIFSPEPSPSTPRYVADKLARWAVTMSAFNYTIEHVPGENNVWGDLLSRWGNSAAMDVNAAVWSCDESDNITRPQLKRLVTLPLPIQSPLTKDFQWPTLSYIEQVQNEHVDDKAKVMHHLQSDPIDHVGRINGLIWIPPNATELQLSILVIAHAGAMGHRGMSATKTALMQRFTWKGIGEDAELFVRNCLQCMCVGSGVVPRPLGEVLHAVEPNKLIHCDFLSMPGGYIHVLVDDASRLCQLTFHDGCKAVDGVSAMQQWFSMFGIVETWVSDQGPHYKNEIVNELRRIYGSGHKFTPAHCPWVNGTVEVMMRSINKTFKTMLLELKLEQNKWLSLIPVVQHALNHTPCSKLNGIAPITAMTQLEPSNSLNAFLDDDSVKEITHEQLAHWRESLFTDLANARDNLHHQLAAVAASKRDKERLRRNKKHQIQDIRLSVGDYVLVGKVTQSFAAKLQVQWLGPRRIVDTLSDWIYHVEDLRDKTRTIHHASRLKLFAAADLNVTQDLLDHIAYVEGGHLVERFIDCRFDRPKKSWVILVQWFGLDELENSWEPVENLLEDVPAQVHKFLDEFAGSNPHVNRLRAVVRSINQPSA
ncbi:hypothetical protein LEN26_018494 [Aphanomyces euteiches]|nr:hypothetical protein LEN26_018494 [Aphanomyces euteiches]